MTIHLPARTEELTAAGGLSPRQIVEQLDRYVVGQHKAKRAVAVALRNRIRRQALPADMAAEVTPKNILMIGPTGVGKTEIARRLAHLAGSPFLKVEASKFTEVGYVGRDVESMVRDLVSVAIEMVRREKQEAVRDKARRNVEEQLLDLLLPPPRTPDTPEGSSEEARPKEAFVSTREKLRDQLRSGALDQRQVEVELRDRQSPSFQIMSWPFDALRGHDIEGRRSRSSTSTWRWSRAPERRWSRSSRGSRRTPLSDALPGGALRGVGRTRRRQQQVEQLLLDVAALSRTASCFSRRIISIATETRSRTIDSTSRPTWPRPR